MMTNKELKRRIEAAKKRLNAMPQWVRDNNRFQGGHVSEYRKEEEIKK